MSKLGALEQIVAKVAEQGITNNNPEAADFLKRMYQAFPKANRKELEALQLQKPPMAADADPEQLFLDTLMSATDYGGTYYNSMSKFKKPELQRIYSDIGGYKLYDDKTKADLLERITDKGILFDEYDDLIARMYGLK